MSSPANKNLLVAGGAVAGVVALAAAAYAFLQFSDASDAKSKRDSKVAEWKAYYSRDPFPDQANIARMEENVSKAEKAVSGLQDRLFAESIVLDEQEDDLTPSQFTTILTRDVIPQLLADAPKDGNMNSIVPEGMNFGFDRYVAGENPDRKDLPRLIRQRKTMEALVRVLYSCGVDRIEAVGREQFERGDGSSGGDSSEEQSSRRGRNRARSSGGTSSKGAAQTWIPVEKMPPLRTPEGISLDIERFRFRFAAREAGVVAFLDAVDEMGPFAMVSDLSFRKDETGSEIAVPPAERWKMEDHPAAGSKGSSGPPPNPELREERRLSGAGLEKPVLVDAAVDVVFPAASSAGDEYEEGEEE